MDFLKHLFANGALSYDEFVKAVDAHNALAENKDKQIKIGNIGNGEYVAKDKFAAKEAELAAANTKFDNLSASVKKFDGVDIDALKTEVATAKTKYETDIAKIKYDSALDVALVSSKTKNPKALKGLLDLEKIKLDGDKLTGFDEQLETIKKSDAYLFGDDPTDGGIEHGKDTGGLNDAAIRAAFGLPAETK